MGELDGKPTQVGPLQHMLKMFKLRLLHSQQRPGCAMQCGVHACICAIHLYLSSRLQTCLSCSTFTLHVCLNFCCKVMLVYWTELMGELEGKPTQVGPTAAALHMLVLRLLHLLQLLQCGTRQRTFVHV
jgi:hypothetical protein